MRSCTDLSSLRLQRPPTFLPPSAPAGPSLYTPVPQPQTPLPLDIAAKRAEIQAKLAAMKARSQPGAVPPPSHLPPPPPPPTLLPPATPQANPNLDPELARKIADARRAIEAMTQKRNAPVNNPYLVSPLQAFSHQSRLIADSPCTALSLATSRRPSRPTLLRPGSTRSSVRATPPPPPPRSARRIATRRWHQSSPPPKQTPASHLPQSSPALPQPRPTTRPTAARRRRTWPRRLRRILTRGCRTGRQGLRASPTWGVDMRARR